MFEDDQTHRTERSRASFESPPRPRRDWSSAFDGKRTANEHAFDVSSLESSAEALTSVTNSPQNSYVPVGGTWILSRNCFGELKGGKGCWFSSLARSFESSKSFFSHQFCDLASSFLASVPLSPKSSWAEWCPRSVAPCRPGLGFFRSETGCSPKTRNHRKNSGEPAKTATEKNPKTQKDPFEKLNLGNTRKYNHTEKNPKPEENLENTRKGTHTSARKPLPLLKRWSAEAGNKSPGGA